VNAIAANQGRTFSQLLAELSPYIGVDRNLPSRIQQRLAKERRFGSRDRRLYRELLYTAVRYWPWVRELLGRGEETMISGVAWLATPGPALQALKDEWAAPLGPTCATITERANVLGVASVLFPTWVEKECPEAAVSPNVETLHRRASLWVRLQTDRPEAVFAEWRQAGWSFSESPLLPGAVEIANDVDLTQTHAFKSGLYEVQDLGSQWVLAHASSGHAWSGHHWLDACAGAGGKTLQLAALLGSQGAVTAHDVRDAALAELSTRAQRAQLRNVSLERNPTAEYDGVLVDAPCTGSGTWRRSPHLKWCTRAEDIERTAQLQLGLLNRFAANVRSGGVLLYATCSLCRSENEAVVARFLEQHPRFTPAAVSDAIGAQRRTVGHVLWPATHNTDGFYAAVLRRS
jgi:16S rRNA (cytosine967-C5)-methyltransferase